MLMKQAKILSACRLIMIILAFSGLFHSAVQGQNARFENRAVTWQNGLAGAGSALSEGPSSIWTDPAASIPGPWRFESHITVLPASISIAQVSASARIRSKVTAAISVNHEMFGTFDARDEQGALTGSFSAGHTQYLANASVHLSGRLSAGYSVILSRLSIDDRSYSDSYGHYGLQLRSLDGKNRLSLSLAAYPEGPQSYQAGFSRQLAYLPASLNIDHTHEGPFDISRTRIGIYASPDPLLDLYGGLSLQRQDVQTQSLGDDFLAGLAAGAAYRIGKWKMYLSFFHYGGPGIASSTGLQYYP